MNPLRRYLYPAVVIASALLCVLLVVTMQGLGLIVGFALLLSSLLLYQVKKVAGHLESLVGIQFEAAASLRSQSVRLKSEMASRPQDLTRAG